MRTVVLSTSTVQASLSTPIAARISSVMTDSASAISPTLLDPFWPEMAAEYHTRRCSGRSDYHCRVESVDLWRRLAARPNAVRFEELDRLLIASVFIRRHSAGSHYTYSRGRQRLVVPRRRPYLLPVYVRLALRLTREDISGEEN